MPWLGARFFAMPHHRNPRHLLTPAMHALLDRMARVERVPLHAMTPAQARQAYAVGASVLEPPGPALHQVQDVHLSARDGATLTLRLYRPLPSTGAAPALLYLHGGGFTVGGLDTHDALCRQLARTCQGVVAALDYRLAPEHRFPTAFNDSWDALSWLAQHAPALGLDARRLAVGGDSAGGTLAAACAVQARDQGLPLALQLLFYPGTVPDANTDSHRRFGHGFLLEAAHIDYFFDHYIPDRAQRHDWRFAPLLAELDGVAPAWLGLAECDPLVDEGLLYGDKLRAAGVAVDLELYRGVTHEFIKMGRSLPEARQALLDAGRALRAAWQLDAAR
ncbi:MAG: alpha/beta hydrolase [Rhodoferax sp.]